MSSSPGVTDVSPKECHVVQGLRHVKSVEVRVLGLVWQFGERVPIQVESSSSFDHGSELRGPSRIALVLLHFFLFKWGCVLASPLQT
ncbi:hypothetical protein TNCV_3892391 [Trichonephila clavipes]|nr:hypothetical protein TNCV_3892391 [Trichonephila clavipes]